MIKFGDNNLSPVYHAPYIYSIMGLCGLKCSQADIRICKDLAVANLCARLSPMHCFYLTVTDIAICSSHLRGPAKCTFTFIIAIDVAM